ncbi:hypothetical protein BHQ23_13075 [Mycobacterium gordonae]|nr:hypothetical protein BHQ23_13075 [Mycobacterium gordonae]
MTVSAPASASNTTVVVERKVRSPGAPAQAPVDKDLYELPPEEAANIPQAPTQLSAVIDKLEEDHEYLTEGGVFTPDLIETWINFKRENEILPVQIRPHPYEFALYYDV